MSVRVYTFVHAEVGGEAQYFDFELHAGIDVNEK